MGNTAVEGAAVGCSVSCAVTERAVAEVGMSALVVDNVSDTIVGMGGERLPCEDSATLVDVVNEARRSLCEVTTNAVEVGDRLRLSVGGRVLEEGSTLLVGLT